MKTHLFKISSIFLAFLVLFSTMSFTIDAHYCGNILVDKAIMKKAETCAMHKSKSAKSHENSHQKNKADNCCDNETETIEGQDELQFSKAEFSFEMPNAVFAFSFIYLFGFAEFQTEYDELKFYDPPEFSPDLNIQHQVFII
ncbi:HYC_CC_PP family protein [Psychroflexus aestuariivivens]|uniref:HYC_CC_PP family protein n=1 Tax=Psychroflexus aestuariivivens TaxID=1795040 RepID=UPI000FD998C6|nr:hypothetical protein [Psychroflexus aestuariivivens]